MLSKKVYQNGQPVYHINEHCLTFYYKSGQIKAKGGFVNQMMEGQWDFYRADGQLWQVGHFLNNQKHGIWTRYKLNYQIEKTQHFEFGKPIKNPGEK